MTWLSPRGALSLMILAGFLPPAEAADWTRPVEVTWEGQRCLSYRARLDGAYLLVEATPGTGWHTFTMDNALRAAEKLAGKMSLGTELPTEILVEEGLELDGPWLQTPPKDFSKPEMRWYSWGYDERTLFAAKTRRTGPGPAGLSIRGQVCNEDTCRNVDVRISLPLDGTSPSGDGGPAEISKLVEVRR